MNLIEFKDSLKNDSSPDGLNLLLKSLWYDAKGDWEKAHQIAQEISNENGSWIHAYLHRKEGDLSNAQYWYSRANKSMPKFSLQEEWDKITSEFLK